MRPLWLLCTLAWLLPATAMAARQTPDYGPAVGIALEGYDYPFPVHFLPLQWQSGAEQHPVRLAYMDVPASVPPNGHAVLLLSGRNFPASYWDGTIHALAAAGYRVIAPDQIGFGKSSKPEGNWTFDTAATNTLALLDKLGLLRVDVVGASMGGMLALRLAHDHPDRLRRMVLESPLGLEDYSKLLPAVPKSQMLLLESGLTAEAYRYELASMYHITLPPDVLEQYVALRERLKGSAEYPRWVESYVSGFYAIYGQPVLDLIPSVTTPTLFIVGDKDRATIGRSFASDKNKDKLGHIPQLAQTAMMAMPNAQMVQLNAGHLVHLEQSDAFNRLLLGFLSE